MCGLVSYFARESVPPMEYFDMMFTAAEKRGEDGVGLSIIKRDSKKVKSFKFVKSYSDVRFQILQIVDTHLKVGDVLIGICRAAPETEPPTTIRNMQPIVNLDCVLAHNGAVSKSICNEIREESLSNGNEYVSDIDSESIIHAYKLADWNIQKAMQRISGGVAAIMYDINKDCLLMINDFKPTAQAYLKGYGYFLASEDTVLGEIIEGITGCTRDGVNLWEMYYHHYLSGGRIKSLDCDSGFVSNIKYRPRFRTQKFDSSRKADGELCLVAASGGLDSSLTLSVLKLAGYENIVACHFKYGHRGQDAELNAITKVTDALGIELKVFDIEDLVTGIDPESMLIDKNAEITTGTTKGLKQVDAWVAGRNMIFVTLMASFAEAQTMKHNYETVNILGGFCNLTESGHYPDNSEYFLASALNLFKYGTLIGDRIKPLYCLSNLMKSDQFALIEAFGLEEVYRNTISCDRPLIDENGIPRNCSHNGIPACGSGLLSYWASKMVGMDDMELRNFYETEDEYEAHRPAHLDVGKSLKKDINSVISRILLPPNRLDNLRSNLKGGSL